MSITIKGVTIGDKFISPTNRKSKRVSEVYDFIEQKSMVTGEIVGYTCMAKHDFLGQSVTFETPFATVLRNKTI